MQKILWIFGLSLIFLIQACHPPQTKFAEAFSSPPAAGMKIWCASFAQHGDSLKMYRYIFRYTKDENSSNLEVFRSMSRPEGSPTTVLWQEVDPVMSGADQWPLFLKSQPGEADFFNLRLGNDKFRLNDRHFSGTDQHLSLKAQGLELVIPQVSPFTEFAYANSTQSELSHAGKTETGAFIFSSLSKAGDLLSTYDMAAWCTFFDLHDYPVEMIILYSIKTGEFLTLWTDQNKAETTAVIRHSFFKSKVTGISYLQEFQFSAGENEWILKIPEQKHEFVQGRSTFYNGPARLIKSDEPGLVSYRAWTSIFSKIR